MSYIMSSSQGVLVPPGQEASEGVLKVSRTNMLAAELFSPGRW